MITETPSGRVAEQLDGTTSDTTARALIGRISRLEVVVAAVIAAVMLVLVLVEPDVLEAPFENEQTLLFTLGGTLFATVAFVAMLRFRVPVAVRVIVLVVPFVIVSWWLISPYFIDDVVDEAFSTSIAEQVVTGGELPAVAPPDSDAPPAGPPQIALESPPPVAVESSEQETATPAPTGPVLLGSGEFVGLAGHSGTGDAGIFQNPDGSLVVRFENLDIENGPDLEVYLVPGPDQVSLADGSIPLGALEGNIGDQNYELPPGTELAPGAYTVLVWCEAFSVEFVGATIIV